jgi:hypothetical protein
VGGEGVAKNYIQDATAELEKCTAFLIKRYKEDFDALKNVKFLFVWKMGDPEYDDEKVALHAKVKMCPVRERDIYGKDVEMRVHLNSWMDMTKAQKTQLVYHELLHVRVLIDEDFELTYDDDGRLKIEIVPHDVVIKAFAREIEEYGLPSRYVQVVTELNKKVRKSVL